MSLIKGIHHIALDTCSHDEFEKAVKFYTEVLGLSVKRDWGRGIMIDAGNAVIEIFDDCEGLGQKGTIAHFAFAMESVDECVKAVMEAGYEIIKEPKEIVIPSKPEYPAKIAFCKGPLGEEIEFFQEL